jgi:hypothetical protein
MAILCFGDLIEIFGDEMLPLIDGEGITKPSESALCQLLLKSVSKDKKFVLDASQNVLHSCCKSLSAPDMIKMLLPYAKHKCAPTQLMTQIAKLMENVTMLRLPAG